MKLYALPENVINKVLEVLQELPARLAVPVIAEVQKARLVVDGDKNPVELPDETITPVTPEAPAVTTATPAQ